ncbi:SpoIIE family protein phosphatase [Actinomadura nitritigenes]|uniref:SpoIIE family protein phosphatase n=1 Tax=Actinomadura nitritigenes TaxID=134602 RepID=UPI003D8EE59A
MGSRRSPASAGPDHGMERLGSALVELMLDVGASIGAVFLLPAGERVLRLSVLCGAPQQIAAPWERVSLDDPNPVPDAVRQRRLVWLSGPEEVARRYPRLALTLPYDYVLAVVPIVDGADAAGGVSLFWPISRPRTLSPDEHEAITVFRRRAIVLLRPNSDGEQMRIPDRPHLLPPPRLVLARPSAVDEAQAAVRFAERLPAGCCALDLDGRVVFANSAATDMLGVGFADLKGARPWEAVPWLRDPTLFEDHYRAAVVSRQSSSFTATRPPGTRLTFHLHPDTSGISIQITPAGAEEPVPSRRRPPAAAEPTGVSAIYQLTHLAAALTEAVGLNEVVDLVGDQIVPAFGPSAMALMAAQEGRLRVVGHRGAVTELVERLDGTPLTSAVPAAQTLASGRPAFFASFADLRRAYPRAIRVEGMDARAFLPLIASDRIIGSLILTYEHSRHYSRAERAMLMSLAGLIAQALDRARLYDTKHQLAHALQAALLPRGLPRIDGLDLAARYQPAGRGMDIGGDFYDLIRIDGTTAVATIGDVQGHHTTAAALMGQVRTGVHAHAATGAPPGDILARTNRLLVDLDPGLFTSCLIARLDLQRRRAQFATAGHPPPLIRHPDGETGALPLSPGLLLGIDPDADYPTTEIPLAPGTVLALYTDGMVEVPGTDIDETTTELARQLARATGLTMDEVADTLQNNAPTAAQRHDDTALLLIQLVRDSHQPADGR